MKSIYVDWLSERSRDNWEFVGRQVLEEARGEWAEDNPNGVDEDEGYPIYNYAYPLFRDEIGDETVLKVCEKTNCTVVYNRQDGRYYLALTGCGMDMSQCIALAYLIVDGCIDWDMLEDVYIAGPLGVGKEAYGRILSELDRQLGLAVDSMQTRHEEVKKRLEEYAKGNSSSKGAGR